MSLQLKKKHNRGSKTAVDLRKDPPTRIQIILQGGGGRSSIYFTEGRTDFHREAIGPTGGVDTRMSMETCPPPFGSACVPKQYLIQL